MENCQMSFYKRNILLFSSNLGTVYFGDGAMGVKEVTCKE